MPTRNTKKQHHKWLEQRYDSGKGSSAHRDKSDPEKKIGHFAIRMVTHNLFIVADLDDEVNKRRSSNAI